MIKYFHLYSDDFASLKNSKFNIQKMNKSCMKKFRADLSGQSRYFLLSCRQSNNYCRFLNKRFIRAYNQTDLLIFKCQ